MLSLLNRRCWKVYSNSVACFDAFHHLYLPVLYSAIWVFWCRVIIGLIASQDNRTQNHLISVIRRLEVALDNKLQHARLCDAHSESHSSVSAVVSFSNPWHKLLELPRYRPNTFVARNCRSNAWQEWLACNQQLTFGWLANIIAGIYNARLIHSYTAVSPTVSHASLHRIQTYESFQHGNSKISSTKIPR